jgi:3-oxoacyl-[acyl-carrier protein] reductase
LADGDAPLLEGKSAFITGAGRGIGRSFALAYAAQGAKVALFARSPQEIEGTAEEIRVNGGIALAIKGDVRQRLDVERAVSKVLVAFGRIDVLVNNAGVITPIGPLWEVDPAEWQRTIEVNLGGMLMCCRAVIPVMIGQGGGRIVNLSGAGGGALPYFSAYAASKAAVACLTETLAGELIEANIQVNALAPGAVRTRMTEEVVRAGSRAGSRAYESAVRVDEEGRTAEKATELALFLASDAAGGITGRVLSAVWDDWRSLPDRSEDVMASDLYTLRRITPQKP